MADDLTSVFRPYDRKEPKLDFLNRDKFVIGIEQPRYKEIPSNYKKLSANEIHLAREELDHNGLFENKLVKRFVCPLRAEGRLRSVFPLSPRSA